MKYTVVINQAAAVALNAGLDLSDMAIFDYISCFANSQACLRVNTPEGIFFWVSHKKIIEDMPLLGVTTTRSISNKIDKLIAAQLLVRHPQCELYQKTLYAFGPRYDEVFFTPEKNDDPLKKISPPPEKNFTPPLKKISGDNIIIDNIITDNENERTRKKKMLFRNSAVAALVKDGDYSQFERAYADLAEMGVDLVYYYNAVADWSDSSDTKRTERGWGATIRNFVRGDIQRGCLRKVAGASEKFSMDYLEGNL